VVENNVISEKTKVKLTLPDGTIEIREYPFRELKFSRGKGKQVQETETEADNTMDLSSEELAALLEEEKADMRERSMSKDNL